MFGHSYMQYAFGTYYQTGRADSLLRGSLDIEHANWQNYAVNGSRACIEDPATGGFNRFLHRVKRGQRGGPYVADNGALVLCYGINDLGMVGITTQIQTAYIHAMRTMISMWRAGVIYENSFQVGTRTSYGAGFSSVAATYTSGGTAHWCTATTNANFTLTLPSDYNGEIVAVSLVGAGGVAGGIVTWGGTAGATGTTSTSDILPSSAVSHCPVTKRFVNGSGQSLFTSANAGQTITGTVNTLDSGGAVMLDCWWLEAKEPPPVIVCNTARLTATGYTSNYAGWGGTEASRDGDVNTLNGNLRTLVAEFDGMVQIADMDGAIGKTAAYLFSDGLHPNELGAARIVDAIHVAIRNLKPTGTSPTSCLNPSAPRTGPALRPRVSGSWYAMDYSAMGTYTFVSGDLFAMPVWVTQGREFWNRLCVESTTSGGGTATLRWGLYDDVGWSGYPRELVNEATAGGVFTLTTGTGAKMSPTSGGGSFNWVLDPGLYWLAMKVATASTQVIRTATGANGVMPNVLSTGLGAADASVPNCYKLTGQGTGALASQFPASATATVGAPLLSFQVFINPTN